MSWVALVVSRWNFSPARERVLRNALAEHGLMTIHRGMMVRNNVSNFCDGIHEQLEALQGRMEMLKSNIGTTWHFLQEKLIEVRNKSEATHRATSEAEALLEQWTQNRTQEASESVNLWIANRETQLLAARAQQTEDCANMALLLARASIDDAERMILEAISAWLDADAVTLNGLTDSRVIV